MDTFLSLRQRVPETLLANLLAALALVTAVLVACWAVRRLVHACGGHVGTLTGSHRAGAVGQEAARHAARMVLWLTVGLILLVGLAGVVYHAAGRDIRHDVRLWLSGMATADLVRAAVCGGEIVLLVAGSWALVRLARRVLPRVEKVVASWLTRPGHGAYVRAWFSRLDAFVVVGAGLGAAWAVARLLALAPAEWFLTLAVHLTLILAVVRLVPLAAGVLLGAATDLGDRHLVKPRPRRYWERVRRLFPFGLRCLEAAVYVHAASLAVRELDFVKNVAEKGDKVVACIGIFFGCRVVIELSQVLLNEAFGLYDEGWPADQKRRTLVPLLQSVCQYGLYFGSAVAMLDVFEIPTGPILAGAGLVGLAVGLGAQSLVTDVVSGFFILFEEQYLVGDAVKVGDAVGRVEVVGIRHTQVRDGEGKLHIIPNGQIKGVVNFSRGYRNAVVDLKLPAEADLDGVLQALREAGRRLRQEHGEDVLADTEVRGLVELGLSEMTARAVTRVAPEACEAMEAEYRRLVRRVLDERRLLGRSHLAA
jgi:small conductance mechanosensitive channel